MISCDTCAHLGQKLYHSQVTDTKRICMSLEIFIPQRSKACEDHRSRLDDDMNTDDVVKGDLLIHNRYSPRAGKLVKVVEVHRQNVDRNGHVNMTVREQTGGDEQGTIYVCLSCYLRKPKTGEL